MQKQNFEKQVHKLMDDLVIPPSPPVWDKVEEQIRRKNERRRIVLWLLPVLLISAGLLWWMASNNKIEVGNNNDVTTTTTSKQENINSINEKTKPGKKENLPASPDISSLKELKQQSFKKQYFLDKNNTEFKVQTKENITNTETIKEVSNNIPATRETEIIIPAVEAPKGIVPNISDESNGVKKSDTTAIKIKDEVQSEIEKTNVDSSVNVVINLEPESNIEILTSEKTNLSKLKSKWKLVPYLAAGFSNVSKGFLDPVAVADFYNVPGSTAGSGSGSFSSSSTPLKGIYFSGGLRIAKNLNSRFSIASGLHYNYFSTKQNIGTRVNNDTTIFYSNQSVRLQDYYQNGNANRYTNKYHFISIPVAIEYQLHKKAPLSIETGFSINRLISTNALLYNRNSNIQFENDKAWNKMQLHSFLGIQYHFLKNKPFSFKAGPFIQYSLTRLDKTSNSKQFLSVAGLQTQFYFENKK